MDHHQDFTFIASNYCGIASTNNTEPYSPIFFKFVNAGYPDLLMEGAEHQQQFLKVCLYC